MGYTALARQGQALAAQNGVNITGWTIAQLEAYATSQTSQSVPPIISMLTQPTNYTPINGGNNTMATAGQDLSLYSKIDTALGGILPGGVEPQPGAISTALRVAGVAAGTAATAGILYGAYKLITNKDGSTKLVKRKHMNYANPKALAKAERRMKSYVKHSRKHLSAMGYKLERKWLKMGMGQVSVAAATAVLGYDLTAGTIWAVQGNRRAITGFALTGSAAAGDTKVDLYVDQVKIGEFYNTTTGFPTKDHFYQLNSFVPAGSKISIIVTDAASTNPINAVVQWSDV